MYCYKTSEAKTPKSRGVSEQNAFMRPPVQLKKLGECTVDELKAYRSLLWSEERFQAFVRFYQDQEVGEPSYSKRILDLIQKFQTPHVVESRQYTSNVKKAAQLPDYFYETPVDTKNHIFRVGGSCHLQLGFRSIAVLQKEPGQTRYKILRVLQYSNHEKAFIDCTDTLSIDYHRDIERKFGKAIQNVDGAKDDLAKYMAKQEAAKLICLMNNAGSETVVSGVVTCQVSSCTFAAMTDRDASFYKPCGRRG
ncbi:MAG: hypothetical protein HFH15_14295 [Ruminococcus sp.]|jgi:hypothetical protein|nr:hypothetical protein [Ruminococcus sp.]